MYMYIFCLIDCGIPEGQHSTLDISANGTEIGAYAQKTCDLGYSSRDSWARCTADLDWFDTSCYINGKCFDKKGILRKKSTC